MFFMVSHVRTHMAIKHLLGAKCAAKKSPSIKQKYLVFNIYFKVIKNYYRTRNITQNPGLYLLGGNTGSVTSEVSK